MALSSLPESCALSAAHSAAMTVACSSQLKASCRQSHQFTVTTHWIMALQLRIETSTSVRLNSLEGLQKPFSLHCYDDHGMPGCMDKPFRDVVKAEMSKHLTPTKSQTSPNCPNLKTGIKAMHATCRCCP
eukprot:1143546-Pelagomonas_calceolata.AAC.2